MKANIFGLPCCLSLAKGILFKASEAIMKMLSWMICGSSCNPVTAAKEPWLAHNIKVKKIVENNMDKEAVL